MKIRKTRTPRKRAEDVEMFEPTDVGTQRRGNADVQRRSREEEKCRDASAEVKRRSLKRNDVKTQRIRDMKLDAKT